MPILQWALTPLPVCDCSADVQALAVIEPCTISLLLPHCPAQVQWEGVAADTLLQLFVSQPLSSVGTGTLTVGESARLLQDTDSLVVRETAQLLQYTGTPNPIAGGGELALEGNPLGDWEAGPGGGVGLQTEVRAQAGHGVQAEGWAEGDPGSEGGEEGVSDNHEVVDSDAAGANAEVEEHRQLQEDYSAEQTAYLKAPVRAIEVLCMHAGPAKSQ